MLTLEELFAHPPRVHRGETESSRRVSPDRSVLDSESVERLNRRERASYAISPAVGEYIHRSVRSGQRTIETGCGVSTLVFALAGVRHVCVTRHAAEVAVLESYARERGIALDRVEFVVADSADALPSRRGEPLDLTLIDGKHAFPWPILDWYYTARRLRAGGVVILDDRQLPAVAMVDRFLAGDEGWERADSPDARTAIFRKVTADIDETPWHAQRGLFEPPGLGELARSFLRLARSRLPVGGGEPSVAPGEPSP